MLSRCLHVRVKATSAKMASLVLKVRKRGGNGRDKHAFLPKPKCEMFSSCVCVVACIIASGSSSGKGNTSLLNTYIKSRNYIIDKTLV